MLGGNINSDKLHLRGIISNSRINKKSINMAKIKKQNNMNPLRSNLDDEVDKSIIDDINTISMDDESILLSNKQTEIARTKSDIQMEELKRAREEAIIELDKISRKTEILGKNNGAIIQQEKEISKINNEIDSLQEKIDQQRVEERVAPTNNNSVEAFVTENSGLKQTIKDAIQFIDQDLNEKELESISQVAYAKFLKDILDIFFKEVIKDNLDIDQSEAKEIARKKCKDKVAEFNNIGGRIKVSLTDAGIIVEEIIKK